MAAKRLASNDLNHTNWDQEDEPEEAGTFKKASEETIKNRVIKTARRRNPIGSITSGDGDKKNAFGNFAGFSKSSQNTNTFTFLTNLTNKAEHPKTNGVNKDETDQTFKIFENKSTAMNEDDRSDKSNEYYAKLKGLNESVSNWIKKHVDTNPLINLQPIFRDYEKYLNELDESEKSKSHTQPNSLFKFTSMGTAESNKKSDETSKSIFAASNTANTSTSSCAPNFNFNASASTSTTFSFGPAQTSGAPTFSFGKPMTTTSTSIATSSASPLFTFGNKITPSTTSAGFSFGTNTAATSHTIFGAPSSTTSSQEATKEDNDESDEPPKVEFTPVVEEGHVYTTRCKVFVKKDNTFSDRGVGNLYLKPVPNSEKTQLIVRADTNLGNLLLNFILSKSIPLQRMGKKDVMMVCLPTPDSKPPPTPLLLRVKSPEDADALLDILKKYQK